MRPEDAAADVVKAEAKGPSWSDVASLPGVTMREEGNEVVAEIPKDQLLAFHEMTDPRRRAEVEIGSELNATADNVLLKDDFGRTTVADAEHVEHIERQGHWKRGNRRTFGSTRAYRNAPFWSER